jgi:enamine deaminase RidA (YjgF/YER057c/UK114 family)
MRTTVFRSNGHEFVSLTGEAPAANTAGEEMTALVGQMEAALKTQGLSLADTMRTRLWARDRASRDEASQVRRQTFDGALRSVSSSFIMSDIFASEARVAMDLLAMRPSRPGTQKQLREYDPPIVPLRYLTLDDVVFLSGVTAVLPTLEDQVADITTRIGDSLVDAGTSWDKLMIMSCYLHRSQTAEALTALLRKNVPGEPAFVEIGFADGYSQEGKLVEIETTAWRES